jgi:uncharacterized protein YbjT (DUF2867 family)
MSDDRPVIAVIGASGSQGGSVARALVDRGVFRARALTRNPDKYQGPAGAVDAAKKARVSHFVWSTLPDVEAISGGEF